MEQSISRRGFLKAAAATSAALAVSGETSTFFDQPGQAFADSASKRTMYKTACHGCAHCCAVKAYVEDGVVVKLEGDPDGPLNRGGMCLKGLSQLHTVYSPRRVLHPMKRVGERGENKWEAITWDEALDLAGTQIAEAVKKYGGYSLWTAQGGGGAYIQAETRGINATFGGCNTVASGSNQCAMPREMITKATLGFQGCVNMGDMGRFVGCWTAEAFKTRVPEPEDRLFVIWGLQPTANGVAHTGHALTDARALFGAKTIVVDPYLTSEASKADVWLPVRPGTDSALLLAWIRWIIDNKRYNEKYCKYWTNLPFLINPETKLPYEATDIWPDYVNPAIDPNGIYDTPAYVCFDEKTQSVQPFPYTAPDDSPVDPAIFTTAMVNGVEAKTAGQIWWEEASPWTLEAAAETCWLEADKIEEALELYVSIENSGITGGVFSEQQECTSAVPLGMVMIDAMMGRVLTPNSSYVKHGKNSIPTHRPTLRIAEGREMCERYGVGWMIGWTKEHNDEYLSSKVQAWNDQGRDGEAMRKQFVQAMFDTLGSNAHKGMHQWTQSALKETREAIITGEPYRPRVNYEVSGNKYMVVSPALEWQKAYAEQDFIIQQFPNMTSFTVDCVDLFLPTEEWLEFDNYGDNGSSMIRSYARQQVVHMGEAVNPFVVPWHVTHSAIEALGEENCFDAHATDGFFYETIESARATFAKKLGKNSWDEVLADQDHLYTEISPEDYFIFNQHETIVDDGLPAGFATMSRKVEPYCSLLIRLARTGFPYMYPFDQPACDDYDPICKFKEPSESPLTDTEYPLVLTNGRVPHFHHNTMRHAPFVRECMPAPELKINPVTAAEYGINHGDWVKVTSRRGSCSLVAYLTEGIAPGVLITERFWNPECFDDTQSSITAGFEECNCNVLGAEFQNDVFSSNSYRALQVKIEKGSKPDRVWVESSEFEPFMPTRQNEANKEEVF